MKGKFKLTKSSKWGAILQNGLAFHDYSGTGNKPELWFGKFSIVSFRWGILFNRFKKVKNNNTAE